MGVIHNKTSIKAMRGNTVQTAAAHRAWRTIKSGNRTFESLTESVREDVRVLARQDVVCGVISAEQYNDFTGEEYPAAE